MVMLINWSRQFDGHGNKLVTVIKMVTVIASQKAIKGFLFSEISKNKKNYHQ